MLKDGAAPRRDYTAIDASGAFVERVAADQSALGFFNFASINEAAPGRLKLLAVDAGDGCVEAGPETIESPACKEPVGARKLR